MQQIPDFLSFLINLENGGAAMAAGEQLQEVATAVVRHGKVGKLTLEISLTPKHIREGVVKTVEVDYSVKSKIPQANAGSTIFFTNEEGELSRQDPAQMQIEEAILGAGKKEAANA